MQGSVDLTVKDMSVTIGMPLYGGGIPVHTVMSLLATQYRCATMGMPLDIVTETAVVEMARDHVLDDFLNGPTKKLLWIDGDMVWTPEDFLRIVALSTVRDVVCATYPAKKDGEPQYYIGSDVTEATGDEFDLFEIDGAGLGFCIMDRAVVEAVAAAAPKVRDQLSARTVAQVFRMENVMAADGVLNRSTEDMTFFRDLRALGYKVLLDPTINLGHVGSKIYRGSVMDALAVPALKAAE